MSALYILSLVLFLFVSFLLCFVILIQESKGGGMGASFGGDSGDALFGTSTADVLKRFTGWLIVGFIASCVILSAWTASMNRAQSQFEGAPSSLDEQP